VEIQTKGPVFKRSQYANEELGAFQEHFAKYKTQDAPYLSIDSAIFLRLVVFVIPFKCQEIAPK